VSGPAPGRAPAPPRRRRVSDESRRAFLELLAEGWPVTGAARMAGHGRSTLYAVRAVDERFAREWEEAFEIGTRRLTEEAERRVLEALGDKPVPRSRLGHIRRLAGISGRMVEMLLRQRDWQPPSAEPVNLSRECPSCEEPYSAGCLVDCPMRLENVAAAAANLGFVPRDEWAETDAEPATTECVDTYDPQPDTIDATAVAETQEPAASDKAEPHAGTGEGTPPDWRVNAARERGEHREPFAAPDKRVPDTGSDAPMTARELLERLVRGSVGPNDGRSV
jgi:hypothetical protein